MTPSARADLMDRCLEIGALNMRQRRALYTEGGAIDSALEHLIMALRLATDERLARHLRDAIEDIIEALGIGDTEHAEIRDITGRLETAPPVKWTQNEVIRRVKDPLIDLATKPFLTDDQRAQKQGLVLDVIRQAPPHMVGSHEHPNRTVSNQLQPTKTRLLWDLERDLRAQECAA